MANGTVTAFTRMDDATLEAVASVAQQTDSNMSHALRTSRPRSFVGAWHPTKERGQCEAITSHICSHCRVLLVNLRSRRSFLSR